MSGANQINIKLWRSVLKNGKGLQVAVYYIAGPTKMEAEQEAKVIAADEGMKYRYITTREA